MRSIPRLPRWRQLAVSLWQQFDNGFGNVPLRRAFDFRKCLHSRALDEQKQDSEGVTAFRYHSAEHFSATKFLVACLALEGNE